MTSNITNYNFLHGVLKLYFPDDYFYSKDYLSKVDGSSNGIDLGERIINYIVEKGKPVSKTELRNAFPGISDAMLITTIIEEKQLISWE